MKKTMIITMAALLAIPLAAWGQEDPYRSQIVRSDKLDINIWVDNEDGVYYAGENIRIFFQTSRDAYVAIYGIDTRGQVNLLYPADARDNGFVYGGEVYAIPDDRDDYDLNVTGPEGIEYVQAVASLSELSIPDWYNEAPIRTGAYDDPEEFMDFVNDRYFTSRWDDRGRAYDRLTIYVKEPHYYYKPVYMPNHWWDYPDYAVVYVDYPFGGEVYIDGIFFGIAPLWIPRFMVGWHWVTIYDRYGYCWEDHIDFYHNHTIHIDRTRVKTSRTVVSRFKEVRQQTKKYSRSNFVLSDERVKNTVIEKSKEISKRSKRDVAWSRNSDERLGKSTRKSPEGAFDSKKGGAGTKRIEDTWNAKRPEAAPDAKRSDRRQDTDVKSRPQERTPSDRGTKESSGRYESDRSTRTPSSGTIEGSRKPSKQPYQGSAKSSRPSKRSSEPTKIAPEKKSSSGGKSSGVTRSTGESRSSSGKSSSGKSSSGKTGGKRR